MFPFASRPAFLGASAPHQSFTPPSTEPCIGFPAGFERMGVGIPAAQGPASSLGYPLGFEGIGQPVAESATAVLQRRGQHCLYSPINELGAYPQHAFPTFYGATGQASVGQDQAGAVESIEQRYLRLGQDLSISDLSIPDYSASGWVGISEQMPPRASEPFKANSQPWYPVSGMIGEVPVNTFFDPAAPSIRKPLACEKISDASSLQPRKRRRRATSPSFSERDVIFPKGLDFSELQRLPKEFVLEQQMQAANSIFMPVPKNHKDRNDLSEKATCYLENLRNNYFINDGKAITKQTLQEYLCKAYRFIRFIESGGVPFDKNYVNFNFRPIFDRYNQICKRSRYYDKNYRLNKNFRTFFYENKMHILERDRPLVELEKNLSESNKATIFAYENFLESRLEPRSTVEQYRRVMIRFGNFLSKTKTRFLANVNESNANALYDQCFDAGEFKIAGKGFKNGKPKNPSKDAPWLKQYLKFIRWNSSRQETALIQVSSDEEGGTNNSIIDAALLNKVFYSEPYAELSSRLTAAHSQDRAPQPQDSAPELGGQAQALSPEDFFNWDLPGWNLDSI